VTLTKARRAELYAMFGGLCAYCGEHLPENGWHADHVESIRRESRMVRVREGTYKLVPTGQCQFPENDHIGNLMPACRACNINKGVASLEGWRVRLERQPQVLRDNHSAYRHAERFGLVAQVKTTVVFHFELAALHEPRK
jgi:hypothetical protein